MKKKEIINILIILLLLAFSYYRFSNKTYSINRIRFVMDTQVEISIITKNQNTNQLLEDAFSIIDFYDNIFSYYNTNSLLYNINHSDSLKNKINDDFYNVLVLANDIYIKTNGLYDISIAPLVDIWDFDNDIIPTEEKIQQAIQNIGFDKISFDEHYIYLPEGMKINMGSISKGYIIDKVIDFLIDNNAKEAFVNAGGDIRFYSNNKRKWKIGIQNPRDRNNVIDTLRIDDMAVVTSGYYERYFINNEIRYHHILNPKTGYPASHTASVTIIAPTAFLADALSTAAFVMQPDDAMKLINSFPHVQGYIYINNSTNGVSLLTVDN